MGIRKKKKTEEGSEPLYAVPQRVRRRSVKGPVFLTVLLVVGTAGYFTWRYYLRDTFGIGKAQELVTVQRVRDMMEEQAQENSDGLLIMTQDNATHGAVVKLMDEARNVGVTNISIVESN